MRQGQQNRRGRGRTGRKPQNPLARSYESNGPDVKIRGTAAHIAEKYTSLARDALASGDLVAAESYFQHAEHYNRIIMAAQSQLGPQHGGQPGEGGNGGFRPRWNADDDDGPEEGGPGNGGGDEMRGGGGQDRERHVGNREHHGGGREHYGRRGPNGGEAPAPDANGGDAAESAPSDEGASDPVG
jgi:uncharacterized protein DUF4167